MHISVISGAFTVLWELFLCISPKLWHICRIIPLLKRLHLVVMVLRAGILILHASCSCTQGGLLSCSLDVRVLPGSCGPFLLSFGHAGSTATVEIMDLHTNKQLLHQQPPRVGDNGCE